MDKSISTDFTAARKEFEELRIVLWPDGERKWKVQERFRDNACAKQRDGEDADATTITTVEMVFVARNTTTPDTMRDILPNRAVGNFMPVTLNSASGRSEEPQDSSYLSSPIKTFEVGSPRWQMHMEELDVDRQAERT